MTDRELLELAAKAAGYVYLTGPTGVPTGEACIPSKGNVPWNPLTDDGDALRLAVKLRLQIQINDRSVVVERPSREDGTMPPESYEYPDSIQGEDYEIRHVNHDKATRRAIVRAAAEIGKAMP